MKKGQRILKSAVLKRVGTAFVAFTIALGGSYSVQAANVTLSTNQYTEASRTTVIGTTVGYPQSENTYFHNLSVNTDGNLATWTSGRNLYLYNKSSNSTEILQTSTVNLYDAVISLDGSYIVYKENLSSTSFNLIGYSVASKAKKVLATSTQKFFGVPSLSQDGSKVAFAYYNGTRYVAAVASVATEEKTFIDPTIYGAKYTVELNGALTAGPIILTKDGKKMVWSMINDGSSNVANTKIVDLETLVSTKIYSGGSEGIHPFALSQDETKLYGMAYDSSLYKFVSINLDGTGLTTHASQSANTKLQSVSPDGSVYSFDSVSFMNYPAFTLASINGSSAPIGFSGDSKWMYFYGASGMSYVDLTETKSQLPNRLVPLAVNNLASKIVGQGNGVVNLSWTPSLAANQPTVIYRDGVKIATAIYSMGSYSDTTVDAQTKYTYTIESVNPSGTTISNPTTITTISVGSPKNLKADVTGRTTATLTWDALDGAKGYQITTGNNTFNVASNKVDLTGLNPGNPYEYVVKTIGSDGTTLSTASNITFTTLTVDPTYEKPSSLLQVNATPTSITVGWDEVAGTTGYILKQNGVIIYDGSATEFISTGLDPDLGYKYSVVAKFGNAMSGSVSAIFKTKAIGEVVIATPSSFVLAEVNGHIEGTYAAVPGATGYIVQRNDKVVYSGPSTTFTDLNMVDDKMYTYTLSATNGAKVSSPAYAMITIKKEALAAPAHFMAKTVAHNHVLLTWDANPTIASYVVERNGVAIATVNGNVFDDTGVQASSEITYKLYTVSGSEKSEGSTLQVNTPAEALKYPMNLTVTKATYDEVGLKWQAVEGAERYEVYRDGQVVQTTTDLRYLDEHVTAGASHIYGVKARKGSLTSEMAVITVKVPQVAKEGEAPQPPKGLKVTLASSDKVKLQVPTVTTATYYELWRDGGILVSKGPLSAFVDDTTAPNETYEYQVFAANEFGKTRGDTITVITPPVAPNIVITPAPAKESLTITWSFNVVKDADMYIASRNPEVTYTKNADGTYHRDYYNTVTGERRDLGDVAVVDGTLAFIETGVEPSSTYHYDVTAIKYNKQGVPEVIGNAEVSVNTPADGSNATVPGDSTPTTPTQPTVPPATGNNSSSKDKDKIHTGTTLSGNGSSSNGGSPGTSVPSKGDTAIDSSQTATGSVPTTPAPTPINREDAPSYTDVSRTHFAINEISALSKDRIIEGYEDGMFKPDQAVTRAEFAVMIVRALDITTNRSYQGQFEDYDANAWYAEELAAALNNRVTQGFTSFKYAPNQFIPREQAAIMLSNVSKGVPLLVNVAPTFTDQKDIIEWAKQDVFLVVKQSILHGYPDGSFKPKAHITRAEAAVVIYRLIHMR